MERRYDFEMEFLISLILAVVGVEGIQATRVYVVDAISLFMVIAIFIHISVLVMLYVTSRVSRSITAPVDRLDTLSRYTIIGTFVIFLFFVTHMILNFAATQTMSKQVLFNVCDFSVTNLMLTLFVAPAIVIGVLGLVGYFEILVPIAVSNDVRVSINPKHLRIFSEFSESNPVTVHIRNESDEDLDVQILSDMPEGFEWQRVDGTEPSSSDIDEEFSVRGPGEKAISYDLRVSSGDMRTISIKFEVDYGYGREIEDIEVIANPN